MKNNIIYILIALTFTTCQKEKISLGKNVADHFFVKRNGASMPVDVFGNTMSKTMLIFIAGGPGGPGLLYRTDQMTEIESDYAVAYIDQRQCGISQGSSSVKHTLDEMTKDLDLVIEVLKYRYGKDISLFIIGHSFGGMAVSGYITDLSLQNKLKGFIVADGITDFPLLGEYSRDMIISQGQLEMAAGRNVEEWKKRVDWCLAHPGKLSIDEVNYINTIDGEDLMGYDITNVNNLNIVNTLSELKKKYDFPAIVYGVNFLTTSDVNSQISNDIETKSFTNAYQQVTIPALFIVGQYDFICPPALHQAAFDKTASSNKYLSIVPNAGHEVHINNPVFFVNRVKNFMSQFK
jgi:proline iminopeptidase